MGRIASAGTPKRIPHGYRIRYLRQSGGSIGRSSYTGLGTDHVMFGATRRNSIAGRAPLREIVWRTGSNAGCVANNWNDGLRSLSSVIANSPSGPVRSRRPSNQIVALATGTPSGEKTFRR